MVYRFKSLTKDEKEMYDMVLLDEMEFQIWCAGRTSDILGEDILFSIQ